MCACVCVPSSYTMLQTWIGATVDSCPQNSSATTVSMDYRTTCSPRGVWCWTTANPWFFSLICALRVHQIWQWMYDLCTVQHLSAAELMKWNENVTRNRLKGINCLEMYFVSHICEWRETVTLSHRRNQRVFAILTYEKPLIQSVQTRNHGRKHLKIHL